MADVTNDLLHEVLKQVQARLGNIEDGQREIKSELQALRGPRLPVQQDVSNVYAIQAKLELRLERIERRLDLVEA